MRNLSVAAGAVLSVLMGASLQAEERVPVVQDGSTVGIEYTLTLDDGSIAGSNVGGEALIYVQGDGQLLPALEAQLLGMRLNETRRITLSPEQGYGVVTEDHFHEVPVELIPEDARYPGARLMGQSEDGQPLPAQVREIREEIAILDLNHPLAGQILHFDIKVIDIR